MKASVEIAELIEASVGSAPNDEKASVRPCVVEIVSR